MAHKIHFNEQTGKDSFFSVKEKAWHGLGQIVDRYPTSKEAIMFAGLDYTVEKRSLFTYDNENVSKNKETETLLPKVPVPGYFATMRTDTDTVLGVVGKDYKVIQNVDAFSFFDSIVGSSDGILYETAGALGKGERIFITAKLPGYIRIGKEDLIEQYLFLTTSHNGYGSITAAFTPIRIVCNNTLNAALKNCSNSIKIRHTGNAKEKLQEAHKVMGIANNLSVQLEQLFNHWTTVRITDAELKRLIQLAMVPNKEVWQNVQKGHIDDLSKGYLNICDQVYDYALGSAEQQQETTQGTVFGAYNAVTGYFQNRRDYKNGELKFKSIMDGTAKLRGQAAFDLCVRFAQNGSTALQLN